MEARRGTSASKGSAKQRLRAMERLLRASCLPEGVRREKELQLQALRKESDRSKRVQREKAFSRKYHKVKFFERQKLERRIAQIKKQLTTADVASRSVLQAELVEAEHDLLYVRHFPRHKKYLSLFPSVPLEKGSRVAKMQSRIRARIIRRAEAGLLDDTSRNEEDKQSEDEAAGPDVLDEDDFFASGAGEEEM